MALFAIDIGGSAVKYGVWNEEELVEKNQFPTPITRIIFFNEMNKILTEFNKKYDITGIAVSCPGQTDEETGEVKGWSYVPFLAFGEFQQTFSEKMNNLPVSMMNDANCAALAEMHYGVGKGTKKPLFLIIGSGVGMSFVKDGKIIIDTESELTELGKHLTLDVQLLHGINVSPVQMAKVVSLKKLELPSAIKGKEVFELAKQGDTVALEQIEKLYRSLTEIIMYFQVTFEPEFFAIGGGLSNEPDLLKNLHREIEEFMKEDNQVFKFYTEKLLQEEKTLEEPEIKICTYKNDANLIGAALHFAEVYPQK